MLMLKFSHSGCFTFVEKEGPHSGLRNLTLKTEILVTDCGKVSPS